MHKRLALYLRETFPVHLVIGVLCYAAGAFLMMFRLQGEGFLMQSSYIASAVSLSAFVLLLRVMDEIKDYTDDLRNFPQRPYPSGRVFKSDLVFLMVMLTVVALVLSAINWPMFITSVFIVLYSYGMFIWFFCKNLHKKYLLVAFLTHHPIVFLHMFYLVVCFLSYAEVALNWNFLFLIGMVLPSTVWELSRKIKNPDWENTYNTYSKQWGRSLSLTVVLLLLFALFAILGLYFLSISTPFWFLSVFVFLFFSILGVYIACALELKSKTIFKQLAEIISLLVIFTVIVEALLYYGMWRS